MTGKEYNILDEIRADIKDLLKAQAASEERVIHCRETFAELKAEDKIIKQMAEWSRGKILIFSGGVLVAGTVAGLLVKLL
jgi:hypothetical protein